MVFILGRIGGSGACKGARTKKEKKDMSHFERFVTEGNEKADELEKEGTLLDEGFMWKQDRKLCSKKERGCTQPCSMQSASTAGSNNGRTVESSDRSQEKSGSLLTRVRKRSIERSGVRKQIGIDV